MTKDKNKKLYLNYKLYGLILIALICLYLFIRIPSWSSNITSSAYNGIAATSFASGNGSMENPYEIKTPNELAYFKNILESNDANLYLDKYYIITNDLDFGNYSLSINNSLAFAGHIDGLGHKIFNFNLENSLFNTLKDTYISNINFSNANLNVTGTGAFLTKNASNINVSLLAISMDITGTTDSKIASLVYSDTNSNYEKIILNSNFKSSDTDNKIIAYDLNNTKINYILSKEDIYDDYSTNNTSTIDNSYKYKIAGSKITNYDSSILENFSTTDLITNITKDNITFVNKNTLISPIALSPTENLSFTPNTSGIIDNTVYINDLEADWNYYESKNFVETGGTLPTFTSQNKYNSNNLVRVMITYDASGASISLNETQNKMVYYKWYPVVDGKVTIELIDNPFTNRPNDKGFNGWISDTSNTLITFDYDNYKRYAIITPTKNGDKYNDIILNLHASWINAKVSYISSNNWDNIFNTFDDKKLQKLQTVKRVCDEYDMTGYYYQKTAGYRESYSGYNSQGRYQNNTWCWRNSCTYYVKINNESYDENNTYYYLNNGYMTVLDPSRLNIHCEDIVDTSFDNQIMAGYFIAREFSYNASYDGYYNADGKMVSGTCHSTSCTYYEYLQNTVDNLFDRNNTYYYMATRDTNIAVLNGSFKGNWSGSKPFTFTGLYNGVKHNNYWQPESSSSSWWGSTETKVNIYNDTTIENLEIYSTNRRAIDDAEASNSILANWHNLKIGRGISQNGNDVNIRSIIGGDGSTGSSYSDTTYNLIIESGVYNSASLIHEANNSSWNSDTDYVNATVVYGSDYDRVTGNNSNLEFYYCVGGSWGGDIYSSSEVGMKTIVKSGSFGTSKYDLTTGIYVGGRYGGTHYTARQIKVEGGWIYNLIGGPLSASNRSNVNDTYIYQTGGTIDMITGGAGQTATYGNRIIALTGGKVNYSVFAGSNGSTGSGYDGTVNGTGFIYIGGNALIGDESLVNNNQTLYGSEAGSVFGIGNGKSGTSSIGSSDNSNILITGNAVINNSIYGGGNYGATGISSTSQSSYTKIFIKGGTIKKNVYGGGNQNGSGSSSKQASINIEMTNGTVEGNIYGGSNISGTVYGSSNLDILGGTVNNNIYGGGKGSNTFVRDNSTVNIGSLNQELTINGNVYGGSALGTVNGTSSTNASGGNTKVTVNNGIIKGDVFGGGEGQTNSIPYVLGDITVTINNGNIGRVFGGHDKSGSLSQNVSVYLKGGTIGDAFGGGNKSSVTTTNVYQEASICNNLYGGSNISGDVATANVSITGGNSYNIFGGNNEGGNVTTTYIDVSKGHITNLYGGGNKVPTTTTNVSISGNDDIITNVFGGGNAANATNVNISQYGANINNLYGGSNTSGSVDKVIINHQRGTTSNLYGGNNEGGNTINTTINYIDGTSSNLYGGGNKTNSATTTINITNGSIDNLYGGGNEAGIDDTTINIENGKFQNVFGGANKSGNVTNTNVTVTNGTITNLYGGNNAGGSTINPIVTIKNGNIGNLFGGGNLAIADKSNVTIENGTFKTIYGGGNEAGITNSTSLIINGGNIASDIYGGGNYGTVGKDTTVLINDATILGSAYAGGNGSLATVKGNTSITVNGTTTIGSDTSKAPLSGSLFGGGNAASTGLESENNSTTIVNIAGATIYGNVYGGANTSTIYGKSNVYIGKNAILENNTNLNYDSTNNAYTNNYSKITFDDTFKSATGDYWNNYLNITNTSTNAIKNFTLILDTGDNTLNQCYNCKFTKEGNLTYITPNIYYEGQSVIDANGTLTLSGYWNITDFSQIKILGLYLDDNTPNVSAGDINIKGTIFGGGEANASGDENYDYSFISVTNGINIKIDGKDYTNFNTYGSIFGSGNASSTNGLSTITIKNYGTNNNPHKNISIQRTNVLTIDNSSIMLSGATDRTNEYSDVLFSLSIIDDLKLQNNSSLYLDNGANLLKKLESLDKEGNIELVSIDDESKTVTKNVDNRIYLLEGRNLNIATNEAVTSYGTTSGMTFLGMFTHTREGLPNTGIYNTKYNYGDTLSWADMPNKGSYVLGLHMSNHDITKDGFYSNFMDEETSTNIVKIIEPTPKDSNFYMWIIGEAVIEYNISLAASKYSTLGSNELTFLEFSKPNTSFQILGFDYSELAEGINLIAKADISKQAKTEEEANSNFALVMESSNQGWLTNGSTNFKSSDPSISGTTYYAGDSTSVVPSLLFYLYHSKNLSETKKMGTVSISIMAITALDALTNETKRLVINIDLSTALYQTNEYEAAMTPGDKYSLFASTSTNITTDSKFSAYFSLYGENTNLYKAGYHRTLVSSYALPASTKITMLDIIEGSPKYYYHIITEEEETAAKQELQNYGEATYNFKIFTTMGSTSNNSHYDDDAMNKVYYNNNNSDEEFIFIVDFSSAGISSDVLNNSLLVELRDNDDQTIYSVLGIEHEQMRYNLYSNRDSIINVEASINKNPLYVGNNAIINLSTNYQNLAIGSDMIYDTKYFDSKLGLKIILKDNNNKEVTGNGLIGAYFLMDGKRYYPDVDGTTRIKIADKVGNVSRWLEFNTENASIATGTYKIVIETFGSPDGIYYGTDVSAKTELELNIINSIYGLKSTLSPENVVIDTTLQEDAKNMKFTISYDSGLSNPVIHMSLYRRKYDSIYDTDYELVDLNDYVSQALFKTDIEKEYVLISDPEPINELNLLLNSNVKTGTYKLEFKLYDGNTYIGKAKNYIIIK